MSDVPAKVLVRPYQPTDQPQIEWLHARTPPWGQVAWRPQLLPADLRRIPELYPGFHVAVEDGEQDEVVIGMAAAAAATPATLDAEPPAVLHAIQPVACLRHVAVAPERWRMGIGRRLVGAAIEWSRSSGFRSLLLNTTPEQEAAVALYVSAGFTEAARSTVNEYQLIWFVLKW